MDRQKLKRANIAMMASGALLVAVIGVSVPVLTWSNLDASLVAKANALSARSGEIYSTYDKRLELMSEESAAKLPESNVIADVGNSAEKKVGIVVPQTGDTSDITRRVKEAGLDPSHVVQDSDGAYVYLIQPGDTLSYISKVFGYSVDHLANYNQIRDVNLIYSDSSLRIPKD